MKKAPTPEQIREAFALAKRAWAYAAPDDEFLTFEAWTESLDAQGLAAICEFVKLARYGVN